MKRVIRWGLVGPGTISRQFADALGRAEGAQLVAVASRDLGRANAFAGEFGVRRAYDTLVGLLGDPAVDAVYIGTPHSLHAEQSIQSLDAGKHVLCEKSLAINAAEVRDMIQAARRSGRLLMEAMWTRFLPAIVQLRGLLDEGRIGELRVFQADFGFRANLKPVGRLLDPGLGGGTLLDLGIYPVSFASMIFGTPVTIQSSANMGPTGVDLETASVLTYARGEMAHFSTSFLYDSPRDAIIQGSEGWIRIHNPWWGATGFTIHPTGGEPEFHDLSDRSGGLVHEAEAFMELIREDRTDSGIMPLAESLAIIQTLDRMREQWRRDSGRSA